VEQAVVYLAPPERGAQLAAEILNLLESLGVRPAFPSMGEMAGEDDEDGEPATDDVPPSEVPPESTPAPEAP
jgi:hypothetical protein